MSTDKWDNQVGPLVYDMLQNHWQIEMLARGITRTYVGRATRGKWSLEFVVSEGLTNDGALINTATKDILRVPDARTVADRNDAELDQLWQEGVRDGRIFYHTVTSEVAELAKRTPYGTAAVWRELPGLKPETLEALAVAGVVSMHHLEVRSDQQLLAVKGLGPDELANLKTELVKLVGEELRDEPVSALAHMAGWRHQGRIELTEILPELRPITRRAMYYNGVIHTVDLPNMSDTQLLAMPSFGPAELEDLKTQLRAWLAKEGK